MQKELKGAVTKLKSSIHFPVEEEEWENHWWGHRYDPAEQKHTIAIPTGCIAETGQPASEKWLLNYLHELIHAYYSETIHPLYGGFEFDYDYPDEVVIAVSNAFRVACDWFIWDKIINLAPEAGCQEIDELFDGYIDDYDPEIHISYEQKYIFGLILALAHNYLNLPLRDESDHEVDKENEDAIVSLAEVFISVNPNNPTKERLEELTNGLLAFGYSYRIKSSDFLPFPTIVITGI